MTRLSEEQRQAALEPFNLLVRSEQLYTDAGRGTVQQVAAAWANFIRREAFFCNCVEPHQRVFWMRPDTEQSGLMCVNCRGIVSYDRPTDGT